MASKRLKEIDILKSIGIILMIIGHLYPNTTIDKWLHSFHMPMFFIISGFLYSKPSNIKNRLLRKVKGLLIPYLFLAIFHLVILGSKDFLVTKSVNSIINYIYHIFWINTDGLPICGAIWFLTAFFFTNIIYNILDYWVKNKKIKLAIISVLTLLGIILPFNRIRLPLGLDIGFMGVGLFYVGIILKCLYRRYDKKIKSIYGFIGIIACIIPIFLNSTINLRLGTYGNIFLYFFNAIAMTVFLYIFLQSFAKSNFIIVRELLYIGQNSIVYLGFNQLVLIFIKNVHFINNNINTIFQIFSILVTLILLHFISYILNKPNFKFLLDK